MSEGRAKRACTVRAKLPRCVAERLCACTWFATFRRALLKVQRICALCLARSSTHYVGYVEDDETPEAIMKKFEALERVQHAVARPAGEGEGEGAGAGADGGGGSGGGADGGEQQVLTEEQLLEVFKQTSVFTVRSALAGLEFMHGHGAHAAGVAGPAQNRVF
jgi:hypothetical protein